MSNGSTDWTNETHKRIVAASLVQSVYDLESGRHNSDKHGMGKSFLAEKIGFEISRVIEDVNDKSYVGTVFKYKYERPNRNSESSPPQYVIAFRGTRLNPETIRQDFKLNFKFVFHKLPDAERCDQALQVVKETISKSGGHHENVWLAGHSLGSAIALVAGRNMVIREGVHLEAYLFNPPFFSYSTHKPFNTIYWLGRSVVTAGMGMLHDLITDNEDKDELFKKLRSWSPRLFVNKRDKISSGYILYFKQREFMGTIGAGAIENVATQNSVISLLGKVVGRDYEPTHLLPSAHLTKTKGSTLRPFKSHGIKQWQDENLPTENKLCSLNNRI